MKDLLTNCKCNLYAISEVIMVEIWKCNEPKNIARKKQPSKEVSGFAMLKLCYPSYTQFSERKINVLAMPVSPTLI